MENLQLPQPNNLSHRHFIALVQNMKDPDFPNIEPLYRFLFGPASVRVIFFRLIYWMPKTKREDGKVYKSANQLAYETGYSARTVERARLSLKALGFETHIHKANGTPTNHYLFDLEKFLQYVATKLKTTVEQVRTWMGNPVIVQIPQKATKQVAESTHNDGVNPAEMAESSPNMSRSSIGTTGGVDSAKTGASLTTNGKTEKTNSIQSNIETATTEYPPYTKKEVVVDSSSLKMEIYSFAATLKIQYALIERWIVQYGLERVKDVAKRAVEDPNVRNPGGWAKLALEKNYQWAEKIPTVPHHKSYTDGPYASFIKS